MNILLKLNLVNFFCLGHKRSKNGILLKYIPIQNFEIGRVTPELHFHGQVRQKAENIKKIRNRKQCQITLSCWFTI